MRLEPGPIPQITSTWLDTSVEQPGFTDQFSAVEFELSLLEQQLDQWIDPAASIDGVLADDGIISAIDGAAADTATAAVFADLGQLPPLDSQWDDTTADIITAYVNTPGEAFQPVPSATDYSSGTPPTVTPGTGTVTITNTSNPGATDFTEGDWYAVNVAINPAGLTGDLFYKVTITWWPETLTGSPGQSTLGQTDINGKLTYNAQWQPGDAGSWDAVVESQSQQGVQGVLAHLYWTVNPAPAPQAARASAVAGPSTPVTVQMSVVGYGINPAAFVAGSGWTLTVTGPGLSDVMLGGIFNGQALTPAKIGTTDASGRFVLNGQSGTAEIGNWWETYTVGGVAWAGHLNFQVYAGG